MGYYHYSVVRCVPEPSTGEFINIGAIAGSWEEGDWSARQIGNWRRALKLCNSAQLGVVSQFIADAEDAIAKAEDSLYPLDQNWLDTLREDRHNIIQLSEPQLAVGDSADQVLDFIFAQQLIDPAKTTRDFGRGPEEMSVPRRIPDGWVEFTDAFIEEVRIGLHAGWRYLPTDTGAALVYFSEDGAAPTAWAIRRRRVLGEPMPVLERGAAVSGEAEKK